MKKESIGIITIKELKEQKNNIEELLKLIDSKKYKELFKKLEDYLEKELCTCLVKKIEDKIIAILWAYEREFDNEARIHINYFAVMKEFQNKKIGKDLLNQVIELAKQKGINYIDLNVDPQNNGAKIFYEKNDFKIEKILMKLNII